MKQRVILSVLLLILFTSCEPDSGISEAFSRYRHKEGVTSFTVPGWVIKVAGRWGDMEREERELLHSIDKVRVLTIDDHDLNARSNFHKEFYQTVARNTGMEELLVVHNESEQVTIFGKGDAKIIEELLILVGGDDNAMIYIKGRIQPEMISGIMNDQSNHRFFSWQD